MHAKSTAGTVETSPPDEAFMKKIVFVTLAVAALTGSATTYAAYAAAGDPNFIIPMYSGGAEVYRWRVPAVTYFNTFGAYSFDPDRFVARCLGA